MVFVKFTVLFLLYFIQAMPYGFQSRYLPLQMRKQGISITSLGLFKLLLIPWILKFFIASLLVDIYKTKKYWLLLTLLMLGLVSLATGGLISVFFDDETTNTTTLNLKFYYLIALSLFVLNVASATQDICVDWLAMNILNEEDLGLGNTIQVGGFKLGTLFSGGLLVYLMDFISLERAFFIFSVIYLSSFFLVRVVSSKSFFCDKNMTKEDGDVKKPREFTFAERLHLMHKSPHTYWICIFVLIYKLGEQSSLNLLPIYLFDNKISSSKIGLWTGIVGQSMSILGSFIGGFSLKKTSKFMTTITWVKYTVIARIVPIFFITLYIIHFERSKTTSTAFQLNSGENEFLLDQIFVLVQFQLFLSGLLTTFTFTLMMEISYMCCEPGIQASHFSLLSTCEVLGKLLIQPLISMYADSYGYSNAFLLFTTLYLICILNFAFYKPSGKRSSSPFRFDSVIDNKIS